VRLHTSLTCHPQKPDTKFQRCKGLLLTPATPGGWAFRAALMKWIDKLDASEVLPVTRDDNAVISFGHCGDDRVERASRPRTW